MPRLAQYLASAQELARKIFAAEHLPEPGPEPAPRERRSALRLLFSLEPLPTDPPQAPRRRGFLSHLFAPEPLPRDPPLPPRRRARWLRWIFVPEALDEK